MLTPTTRWSHPPGKAVVPSPWQATARMDTRAGWVVQRGTGRHCCIERSPDCATEDLPVRTGPAHASSATPKHQNQPAGEPASRSPMTTIKKPSP
jgi:hypothetical protein